jgi:hypothetical protein
MLIGASLCGSGRQTGAAMSVIPPKRHGDDENADARMSGSQKAWIGAFGPDTSRDGLKIKGNNKLAEALLDELAQAASARRAVAAV